MDQQACITSMLTKLADRTPVFSVCRPIFKDDGILLADLLEKFIRRRFLE
jgi:hypothetical protein